jgi:RNA polymerase sigma-70 factor (ECF subfamily)
MATGDAAALGEWYELEWPAVFRLCFGLIADHAAAEDAAQDAMLRISDRIGLWDSTRPYLAWRTTVVLNLTRDTLRRRKTRRSRELASGASPTLSSLPDPADAASRGELRNAVESVLAQLPEREREAFVLCDLEELATQDAADAMGIRASSVRSILALARRRLRGLLPAFVPATEAGGDA